MGPVVYSFAGFELDTSLYQLRRDDEVVKIEPKVFDVLLHLIEHRERVVSKDELLDALWPGSISESVLPRCVTAARKALGDDREGQHVIQTIRGRGYRFVAPVTEKFITASDEASRSEKPGKPTPASRGGSQFVGREGAMKQLRAALADAFQGKSCLVVLVGEPGIGKTRTATELANDAATRGALVLRGRGYEGEGAPAFWPWVQVLRAALEHTEAQAALSDLPSARAEISALVPDADPSKAGDAHDLDAIDDQRRFRLFDAVATLLEASSRARPLVIVFDDLHWSDTASLLLMRHVARQLPTARLLVVGTYRDVEIDREHPLAPILAELAREPAYRRINLRGLERDEVAAFIASFTGNDPSASIVEAVHHMTEGNPFFVEETVRLLVEDRQIDDGNAPSNALGLPQGVREAIARRIDGLSSDCHDVLTVASVVGTQFGPVVIERVTEHDGNTLLELLDEAVAARVLEPASDDPGQYAFAHTLTRETLYEGLSTPKRVTLHRKVGEALERIYGKNAEPHLAELAHHFYQASPGGDVGKAITYCIAAANRAARVLSFEESARHYERSLRALEAQVPVDDVTRCEVLIALGAALSRSGERNSARQKYEQAAHLARGLERADLFAEAALGFGQRAEFGMPRDDTLVAFLEEARGLLDEDDPDRRGRVLARLAISAPYAESVPARLELSAEGLELARAASNPATLAMALAARLWSLLGPDFLKERVALATELLELADKHSDKRSAYQALEIRSTTLMTLSDREGADRDLEAIAELAKDLKEPIDQWYWGWFIASRALTDGRFDEAERLIQAGLAAGLRAEHPGATLLASGQALWLALERGNYDAFVQGIATMVPYYTWADRVSRTASAYRSARLGDLERARAQFEELAAHDFDDIPRDEHWLPVMAQLAWTCGAVRDQARSGKLYHLLSPFETCAAVHETLRVSAGAVPTYLAILASVREDWTVAERHFDQARRMNQRMGAKPYVVRNAVDWARMLLVRDEPGDRAAAARCLQAAGEQANALGLSAEANEIRELVADIE